jgi:hypothetical protein
MIPSVGQNMDKSNRLANALFVRNLQGDNNMAVLHPDYSNEHAIVHGHNFTMDVYMSNRRKSAVAGSTANLLKLIGDLIRLINKFFCTISLGKYEVETFNISFASGSPSQNTTVTVDNKGRIINTSTAANNLNDPTNSRMINVGKDYQKKEQQ